MQSQNYKRTFISVIGLLLLIVLAACGDATSTSVPTAIVATPTPTGKPPATTATTTNTPKTTTTAANTVPSTTPAKTTVPATTATPAGQGKLVYEADNQIFVVNPDGSGRTRIGEGVTPVFSPDGARVAFAVGNSLNFPMQAGIRFVKLDGSGQQDICAAKPNHIIHLLRWSPRDRFIAVRSVPAASDAVGDIALCNLQDGKMSDLKQNLNNPIFMYDWSPDGNNAIWTASDGNAFHVYYGDPDKAGAGAIVLVKGKPFDNSGIPTPDYYSGRFSPDGKTIVLTGSKITFVSVPGQKSSLEGKSIELSRDNSLRSFSVTWSPDGRFLAVTVAGQQGGTNLQLVSLDEKQFGKTTLLAEKASGVDWTRQ